VIPPPLVAAAVLGTTRFRFVLVGSAALWLLDRTDRVRDLDLVPDPGLANLGRAAGALEEIGVDPAGVRGPERLARLDIVSLGSAYGPVDLLLRRGRVDFDRFWATGQVVDVLGVAVRIAPEADVVRLRERYKATA
jgi:hypothetical protein